MNNNSSLPLPLILKYLNSRREELADLKNSKLELKTIVHKIRGNAATFGLPQLGIIAGQIEEALMANPNQLNALEQLTNQMKLEVEFQISQIQI